MQIKHTALMTCVILVVLTFVFSGPAASQMRAEISIGDPLGRCDRLVSIEGQREVELTAEYSVDDGASWHAATIYLGASSEQRRASSVDDWNRTVKTGVIPAGSVPCLWNYFFDLKSGIDNVRFRLRTAKPPAEVVLEKNVDLGCEKEVVVIDAANVAGMCGGALPHSWTLTAGGVKDTGVESITCKVDDEVKKNPTALVLKPRLKGWYRVYLGMEPYSTCRIWLSRVNARYEVPNYYNSSKKNYKKRIRLCRESKICEAEMTGQDVCISPGGARVWQDTCIRYVRFVPMSQVEVAARLELRRVAREKGRPFVGYVEPCTPCHYEPESLTMAEHIRNEMKLNQIRGSTDVYMHVVRIGSKPWYYSDVEERFTGDTPNWSRWMKEGDPMAFGVEQAHRHNLKFFADAGMNACYFEKKGHYKDFAGNFVKQNPQVVCPTFNKHCMDYRRPIVRNYVVSIIAELLSKYDVDGINLDFARWGHRAAYDRESLIDVLRQIDKHRKEAEKKRGHAVLISTRVDFDQPPAKGEPEPIFVAAVRAWAKQGLVERVMVNFDGKISAHAALGHYLDAIKGTDTKLWGDLYWGTWPQGGGADKDVSIARGWVEQGLDGGFFYYMRARPIDLEDVNWRLRTIDFLDVHSKN